MESATTDIVPEPGSSHNLDVARLPSQVVPPLPVAAAGSGSNGACDGSCLLEEEFHVQLVLAISASSAYQVSRVVIPEDQDESAQIDAALQISLAAVGSVTGFGSSPSTSILAGERSMLTYNVINYDEKVMDVFYQVYTVKPSTIAQGRMPLLGDLRALSEIDSIDYEVAWVNCLVGFELQQLENAAMDLAA